MSSAERYGSVDAFWDAHLRRLPKQNRLVHRNPVRSALFVADFYPTIFSDPASAITTSDENSDQVELDRDSYLNTLQVKHRKAALEWLILLHGPGEPEHNPQYLVMLQKLNVQISKEKLAKVRVAWWGEQALRYLNATRAIGSAATRQVQLFQRGVAGNDLCSGLHAVYYPANDVMPQKVGVTNYVNNKFSHIDVYTPDVALPDDTATIWGVSANFWRSVFNNTEQSFEVNNLDASIPRSSYFGYTAR